MKILPQKFCFFCDLRKGVVWLSWFMMLLNIPVVVLMFLIIAQRNTIFFDHPKLESILIPMCIVEIACAFIQIFTNIFLINGVIKKSHLDMLPWLLINKITITLFIITAILIGMDIGMQLPLLIYIVMAFIAATLIYSWLCVLSLFQNYKALNNGNHQLAVDDVENLIVDVNDEMLQ